MFSKERLAAVFLSSIILSPLNASVNQKTPELPGSLDNLDKVETSSFSSPLFIEIGLFKKKSEDSAAMKRQKKLMEEREKALADIEARKAEAERLEQEEIEAQEQAAKELEEKKLLEAEEAEKAAEKELEDQRLKEEEEIAAAERKLKEEQEAAAEAERLKAKAAAEAAKKEQERLQAQIEKELEKQKTASEKNKKEYLSDYMVYDIETINDSDESEEIYTRIDNPDERDASGKTLLMRAAKEGNEWELKQLIESNANVNLKDSDGWTALMYAVRYSGSLECVEKLMEAGADVTVKNNYGFSSLVLAACYNGNPQIVTKLLEYYKASDKEVLKALVFLLSEQNISERQQLSKLQIFMDKAVPLNILYDGKTPLMYAAQYGNSTKTLQVLLDNQSSVTMRSTDGKTAFDYATNNKNLAHDKTYWALNKK